MSAICRNRLRSLLSSVRRFFFSASSSAITITLSKKASTGARRPASLLRASW
ncbi:Uncharacterised protein [Vibrio cholerae]|nr:Uncharacterised protein [Vibrio cholerae]